MYLTFSVEFHWGPDQIRRLTLQQMEQYLRQLEQYRANTRRPDVSLDLLRQALFAFTGAKEVVTEPKKPDDKELDQQLRNFAVPLAGDDHGRSIGFARLTKEESDAWFAAGMPSPFEDWIRAYRRERRRRNC